MTATGSLLDGMRLALFIGVTLAVVNGVWARFSPSHRNLEQMVGDWTTTKAGA